MPRGGTQQPLLSCSIIVPAHNAARTLPYLVSALARQSVAFTEAILVDDASRDQTAAVAKSSFAVNTTSRQIGPSAARNLGARQARGDVLVFFDADCTPEPTCLEALLKHFVNPHVAAVMGSVRIPQSGWLRDSIAALGFPGGGSTGFERIWRVTHDGFTDHISSLNCAIRREVFEAIGGFDPGFPFSCEDAELSVRLTRAGHRIKFEPQAIVQHAPEENLRSFVADQLKRGRGNYILKRKVGSVRGLIRLRLWSTGNIVKRWWCDPKLPAIVSFLGLAFLFQQVGFVLEAMRSHRRTL